MRYEEQPFVEAEMQKYNNFIRLFTGETEEFDRQDEDLPRSSPLIPTDSSE